MVVRWHVVRHARGSILGPRHNSAVYCATESILGECIVYECLYECVFKRIINEKYCHPNEEKVCNPPDMTHGEKMQV
jgi:hypothetical protein